MDPVVARDPHALSWRHGVLWSLVLGSLAVIMTRDPIAQSLAYHRFADRRGWLGVPNFADVASNVPFLIVGVLGAWRCMKMEALPTRRAWVCFFVGVALVSWGSAHYHWSPNHQSLIWDRMPMTVGFMGLFVALLAEYLSPRLLPWTLIPAVLLGLMSVVVWSVTDDLRLYLWVQVAPMLTIPVLMVLFEARYTHSALLLVALGFYIAAKGAELGDAATFALTDGWLGGHAIKHLLAAMAPYVLLRMLEARSECSGLPEELREETLAR